MLYGRTAVRVAADAESGEKLDLPLLLLAEGVFRIEAYRNNTRLCHRGVNVRECVAAEWTASSVKGMGKVVTWSHAVN